MDATTVKVKPGPRKAQLASRAVTVVPVRACRHDAGMERLSHDDPVRLALTRWPLPRTVCQIEPLGNAGGFSGSQLWRIVAGPTRYCLRRWPRSHPKPSQLEWMHHVLRQVAASGCAFVPLPLACRDGTTWTEVAGHRWELTPWMPGQASFRQQPTPRKLESAMESLARWHLAARTTSAAAWGGHPV